MYKLLGNLSLNIDLDSICSLLFLLSLFIPKVSGSPKVILLGIHCWVPRPNIPPPFLVDCFIIALYSLYFNSSCHPLVTVLTAHFIFWQLMNSFSCRASGLGRIRRKLMAGQYFWVAGGKFNWNPPSLNVLQGILYHTRRRACLLSRH